MNPGDRVTWRSWCYKKCYGTIVRASIEFNPCGHDDIEGFIVRPDGWEHDTFMAADGLELIKP